jgi:hypothetical protein
MVVRFPFLSAVLCSKRSSQTARLLSKQVAVS